MEPARIGPTRPAPPGRLAAERIVDGVRALAAEGLVAGHTGNISARVPGGFLVTPTRVAYGSMTGDDLVFVGPGSAPHRAPSLETPMHRAVYAARPDVDAIVHTHSVHATAWSFLGREPLPRTEDLEYYDVGPVRCSAPAAAGSPELGEAVVTALGDSRAALIGRHGAVAVGTSVDEALTIAKVVEHVAHVAWLVTGRTGDRS
jgi:L-fuculose-phosphate aldolase